MTDVVDVGPEGVTIAVTVEKTIPWDELGGQSNADPTPSEDSSGESYYATLPESGPARKVVEEVAASPRAWVNASDLDVDEAPDVGSYLAKLSPGVLVRRERTRDNCQYEYRLKDAYRREVDL